MFDEMMSSIGPDKVKRFRAEWSSERGLDSNFDQYQVGFVESRSRDPRIEAAAGTWTGRRLHKYGFEPTRVLEGQKKVVVIFERPDE